MAVECRSSAYLAGLMARTQFFGDTPPTGDVFVALSSTVFSDLDLDKEFVSDLTWTEYDGTYTRQQVTLTDVTIGTRWRLRGANSDFGNPGTPSAPAVAVLLYQGGSASPGTDGAARVLGWMQGPTIVFLPFTGDGATNLTIPWPNATVLYGPN